MRCPREWAAIICTADRQRAGVHRAPLQWGYQPARVPARTAEQQPKRVVFAKGAAGRRLRQLSRRSGCCAATFTDKQIAAEIGPLASYLNVYSRPPSR